jgi:hypothetical protein
MTAPATAPKMFPFRAIPAPKPHEILYEVSLSGPRSSEKLDTTAGEQGNPSLNRAAASSAFVMPRGSGASAVDRSGNQVVFHHCWFEGIVSFM